jgi:hypothetical protein
VSVLQPGGWRLDRSGPRSEGLHAARPFRIGLARARAECDNRTLLTLRARPSRIGTRGRASPPGGRRTRSTMVEIRTGRAPRSPSIPPCPKKTEKDWPGMASSKAVARPVDPNAGTRTRRRPDGAESGTPWHSARRHFKPSRQRTVCVARNPRKPRRRANAEPSDRVRRALRRRAPRISSEGVRPFRFRSAASIAACHAVVWHALGSLDVERGAPDSALRRGI